MLYRSARLRLECSERVATLWLDADVLNRAMLLDLREAIEVMRRCRAADVLVIRGGRQGTFLSGPDLDEYESSVSPEQRHGYSRFGQETLQQVSELSDHLATIAYIDGECTNAGLELALACDFRLAVARPENRIGFDVLDRGLLPCWGATQRLPRLIGPRAGLDMLLNNTTLPARAAKKLGLVNHAFGPRPAKTELWWFIADVQDNHRRRKPRSWWQRLRDCTPFPRVARPESSKGVVGASAAPFEDSGRATQQIVAAVRGGWRLGEASGFAAERAAFVEYGLHPITAERRQRARDRAAQAESWHRAPMPRHIGVPRLEADGLRLAVAAVAAGGSLAVGEAAESAWNRFRKTLTRAVDDGWLTVVEAEQRLKQVVRGDLDDCDVVFLSGSDAFISEQAVGIQFAGSAVELLPTAETSNATIAAACRWLRRCGHWPTVAQTVRAERVAA